MAGSGLQLFSASSLGGLGVLASWRFKFGKEPRDHSLVGSLESRLDLEGHPSKWLNQWVAGYPARARRTYELDPNFGA